MGGRNNKLRDQKGLDQKWTKKSYNVFEKRRSSEDPPSGKLGLKVKPYCESALAFFSSLTY